MSTDQLGNTGAEFIVDLCELKASFKVGLKRGMSHTPLLR
jgi:hypothetical protein